MKNKEETIRDHNIIIMSRYMDRMFRAEIENRNKGDDLRDFYGETIYSTDYKKYYNPFYQSLSVYECHNQISKRRSKKKISELNGIKGLDEHWTYCYENYLEAYEIYKSLVEREEETNRKGGWCRLPEENEK